MPSQNLQSNNWVFVLNNYTDRELETIATVGNDTTRVKYLVYGKEVGEVEGTPHLQGYFQLVDRKRLATLKEWFGRRLNFQKAGRNLKAAIAYCKKGSQSKTEWNERRTNGPNYGAGADITEYGTPPVTLPVKSDSDAFIEYCRTLTSMPSRHTVIRDFPRLVMNRGWDRLITLIEAHINYTPLIDGTPTLRPWQDQLVQKLEDPAPDRIIDFYYDAPGEKGKTFVTNYLIDTAPGVQVIGAGKIVDMAYMIDPSNRIFIFDVPRSQMSNFNYCILEQLKNRRVHSAKYFPVEKRISVVPHVVVFCNEMPDETALSADRYNIIDLAYENIY